MDSIANMLLQQLDDKALQQISSQLGADKGSTQSAVGAAVPLLISALGRNASSAEGAQALTNALSRDHDGSILDDVAGFLGSGDTSGGQAILGHILGAKQGTVASGLSKATGLDSGSTGQLLAMLAPLVLGGLGKTQRQQGLNADGIAALLGGERQQSEEKLGGLAQLIDLDGDGDITDDILSIGGKLLGGLFGRK